MGPIFLGGIELDGKFNLGKINGVFSNDPGFGGVLGRF